MYVLVAVIVSETEGLPCNGYVCSGGRNRKGENKAPYPPLMYVLVAVIVSETEGLPMQWVSMQWQK